MKHEKRELFDMSSCLEGRKNSKSSIILHQTKLKVVPRIVGAPELSKFRTRVVLNSVLEGTKLEKAVDRAMAITSKEK